MRPTTMSLLDWKLLRHFSTPRMAERQDTRPLVKCSESGEVHSMARYTADAKRAIKRLFGDGLLGVVGNPEYRNIGITAAGLALAETTPKPAWAPPPPPPFDDRCREVLAELAGAPPKWLTPMQVGGTDGSHHSATLTKLVRQGYAECHTGRETLTVETIVPKPHLFPRGKGSRRFRITDAGTAECSADGTRNR